MGVTYKRQRTGGMHVLLEKYNERIYKKQMWMFYLNEATRVWTSDDTNTTKENKERIWMSLYVNERTKKDDTELDNGREDLWQMLRMGTNLI